MKKLFLFLLLISNYLFSNGYSCNRNLAGLRFHSGDIVKPSKASSSLEVGFFVPYQTQFAEIYGCNSAQLQVFIALSLYLNNGQYFQENLDF